jgi:large subunit ribosomal protein L7A
MAQRILPKETGHVIGIKQVCKAINRGVVESVYVADDAEDRVMQPLKELCDKHGVTIVRIATMKELGSACGIEVGAAAAALLKS